MAASPSAALSLESNNIYAQTVNINARQTQSVSSRRDPIEILHEHVAFGALYNSGERFDPPRCHPNTRTAVLDRIEQWADDASADAKPILWLSGPAGAGKSAIGQTLVERWKIKNALVIAFFFWRTASERNQKTRLVPTIALQLLELFPSLKAQIETAVGVGGFFRRTLSFQLEKLVVEPLLAMGHGEQRVIIVIDGLDECCTDLPRTQDFPGQTYELQQQEILEMLGSACQKASSLRLLIISRPERQIRASFRTESLEGLTTSLSLKDMGDASADIRLFLDCRFEEIRKRYGIESSWPAEGQLLELVRKSSGQFIYPSVAIKHVTRTRANPKQSLMSILELQPGSVDNPLAELDMLYTLALKSIATVSLPVVTNILGYLVIYPGNPINSTCPRNSLSMFEKFLFLAGEVNTHLDDLHSVLDIPSQSTGLPIGFIYATFFEYLQDKSRSGRFFIDKGRVRIRYTEIVFRHLDEWGLHPEGYIYHRQDLVQSTCSWVNICPPSRSLMVYLWSLMRITLGSYPIALSHVNKDALPLPSKQLSAQFDSQLKELDLNFDDESLCNLYTRNLFRFLEKCNIPELEPSWLRRYLVRRRLKAAWQRHCPNFDWDHHNK